MINKLSLNINFFGDLLYKLIANVISTIMRNIVVLPFLAKIFLPSQYGEIVTIIGLISTISGGLGNALLSTRLVLESTYKKDNIEGDFNSIAIIVSFISMAFALPIVVFFKYLDINQLLLISCLLFVETFIGYHSGWFILKQAYKKLLIYTIIGALGFGIGLFLSRITKVWIFTYLTSDVFSMLFLVLYSPLIRESLRFTKKVFILIRKYLILILTTVISNALTYLDRLMLYPIIGSSAVAIYSTASVFGKAFNLISLPISSIMLGYYATGRIKLNLKKYWYINFATLIALLIFIILTQIIGYPFTKILFPDLAENAKSFILIANLASAIGASAQITKSAALKYAKTYWTLIIQIIYAVTYILLGYILVMKNGLLGFSYAVLIANLVQIIVLYVVCHFALKNENGEY